MVNFNVGSVSIAFIPVHSKRAHSIHAGCKTARARHIITCIGILLFCVGFQSCATALSLKDAQQRALIHDPYFKGSELQEAAFMHDSEAADSWDNPTITTTLQSVPTDGFSLNQEPMTQLKVGIQQAMPRGRSDEIARNIAIEQAGKEPIERAARRAWLMREVSMDWLTWYQAEQTVVLLRQESQNLSRLLEIVQSSYQSGMGDTQQHDIIKIRLERLRLEDTHLQEQQNASIALAQLSRWFDLPRESNFSVPNTLKPKDVFPFKLSLGRQVKQSELFDVISAHPFVQLLAQDEHIATKKLTLAKEQTKPKWAFEASYGYRQDAQNGMSQADFISVGVQVDLPLFSTKRQDANVSASAARLGATATQRRLEVRRLAALAEAKEAELASLIARQKLFDTTLIAQTQDLAESALNAYMQDQGQFDDVIRARIFTIKAQLDALKLHVDIAKTLTELAYLYYPLVHGEVNLEQLSVEHSVEDTHLFTPTQNKFEPVDVYEKYGLSLPRDKVDTHTSNHLLGTEESDEGTSNTLLKTSYRHTHSENVGHPQTAADLAPTNETKETKVDTHTIHTLASNLDTHTISILGVTK
ncbi:TolC family protein [Alteromonas sp. 1_MG-2023]|uniref:TolC family protein n=1 Tax=Alteromonas sp. 1_MG-2023 TaxID=3062669 RepID=UPI0026E4647A|nr:TolC family protein [Alteromonas sp. 1_MG-2023]MDO6568333.1 TolC family protein [Alteromonas sp. 1_MG-2023]